MFARRELDWRAATSRVYLIDDTYVANLEVATFYPDEFEASVLASLPLTNQSVTNEGWCYADPMVFVGVELTRPCGQAIISKTDDNLAILRMEFPPIPQRPGDDNVSLLFSQRAPGWFRL
jgi:hypothetical protein